jgi:hypothetical protein
VISQLEITMDSIRSLHPLARAWLLDGPLSPYVEGFVIALWFGHESPTTTHQYIEADLAMKEKALSRLQDPGIVARRFQADDALLDFLKTL